MYVNISHAWFLNYGLYGKQTVVSEHSGDEPHPVEQHEEAQLHVVNHASGTPPLPPKPQAPGN